MGRTKDSTKHSRADTEKAALGILLIDQDGRYDPQDLSEDCFYDPRNRDVYTFILEYFRESGKTPDLVTAVGHFKQAGKKGFKDLLPEMINIPPALSLYPRYVEELHKVAAERKTTKLYRDWEEGRLTLQEFQEKLRGLESGSRKVSSFSGLLQDFFTEIGAPKDPKKIFLSPFPTFNQKTGGLFPGELVVLAGRTGKGKTGLMCQWATYLAKSGHKIAFFSLEMSSQAILSRWFGSELGIDTKAFRLSTLSQDQLQQVFEKASEWSTLQVSLEDRRISHISDIEKIVRSIKPEVIFVDYAQRLYTSKSETRAAELDFIVNKLKTLAIEQQALVITAAQLNRNVDTQTEPPGLANIKDSSGFEMTADMVILINPMDDNPISSKIGLDVAKSRHTGRFRFTVSYHKPYQQMREITNGGTGK